MEPPPSQPAPNTTPGAPPTAPGILGSHFQVSSTSGQLCRRCGYALDGLSLDSACPECGTPVTQSLQGDLLKFSSPGYTASLHTGIILIIASLVATILGMVVAILIAIAASIDPALAGVESAVTTALELVLTALAFISLAGWWLLSAPDPALAASDTAASARKFVRIAVAIGAAFSVAEFIVEQVPAVQTTVGVTVYYALGLVGILAWVVQYFAAMLYISRLGPRLPDDKVTRNARRLLWLGPLLWTIGIFLLGLGPLIALLLYLGLLEQLRKNLKRIRAEQAAAATTP